MTDLQKLFWDLPAPLQDQIASIATGNPAAVNTFTQVCDFYRAQSTSALMTSDDASGASKKRKIIPAPEAAQDDESESEINPATALIIKSISVSLPLRKKLDIFLTPTQLVARAPGASATDFALNYRQDRIEAAFLLKVPEKTKPQWNLIVAFTRNGSFEYFQATLLEDTIKNVVQPASGEQYSGSIKEMVILYFQRRNINIISDETIGPAETLFQVTAHRGSKDGLLYFLPGYILFGFKKPLVLFQLDNILSISYSSITRSTFNIIVKHVDPITQEEDEIEFSIIDQVYYDSINRFVTEKQLHNDSMAEKRRAKIDTKAQFPTELGKAHAEQQQEASAAAVDTGLGILDNEFDGSDEEDEDFNSDTKEDNSDSDNDSGDSDEDDEDDADDDDDDE